MKKVELRSGFHHTKVVVVVPRNWEDVWFEIQAAANNERRPGRWTRTLKKVEKVLCGMKDCHCGIGR